MGKLWGFDSNGDWTMLVNSPTRERLRRMVNKKQKLYETFTIQYVNIDGEELHRTVFEAGQWTNIGRIIVGGGYNDILEEYAHVVVATDDAIREWAKHTGTRDRELNRIQKFQELANRVPEESVAVIGVMDGWFTRDLWCDSPNMFVGFVVAENTWRTTIYRDPKNGSLWAPTRLFV